MDKSRVRKAFKRALKDAKLPAFRVRTLGSDPEQLHRLAASPAVRAFNSVLTAACR